MTLATGRQPTRVSHFIWTPYEEESPPYGETDVHAYVEQINWERLRTLVYVASLRLYPKSLTAAVGLGGYTYVVAKIPMADLTGEYNFTKLFSLMADRIEHVENTTVLHRMTSLDAMLFDIAEKHHGDEPDFWDEMLGYDDHEGWD